MENEILTNVVETVVANDETEANEVCNLVEIITDDESSDKPNKAAAIALGGLAAVGAGTIGYGIYKGIKAGIGWIKSKKAAKADELDELEDDFFEDEEEVPVAEEVVEEELTTEGKEEEKPKKKAAPKSK